MIPYSKVLSIVQLSQIQNFEVKLTISLSTLPSAYIPELINGIMTSFVTQIRNQKKFFIIPSLLLLYICCCCCCCCCCVTSVVSDSVRPHRWRPTRLPRPWDSPGKNTGVACHFLLQCMKGKSESEVAQSCPTLHHPMVCSLPGSSVHGIFQARELEWGAIAFSSSISSWY